jgi:hypothetical protein
MENATFIPFSTKLKDHRLRSKWIEMIRRPLGVFNTSVPGYWYSDNTVM